MHTCWFIFMKCETVLELQQLAVIEFSSISYTEYSSILLLFICSVVIVKHCCIFKLNLKRSRWWLNLYDMYSYRLVKLKPKYILPAKRHHKCYNSFWVREMQELFGQIVTQDRTYVHPSIHPSICPYVCWWVKGSVRKDSQTSTEGLCTTPCRLPSGITTSWAVT